MSRDERNIRSNFQVCGSTVNVQCVFSRLRWCKLSPYHLLNRTTLVFMVADSVTTPVVFRVPPWVCLLELKTSGVSVSLYSISTSNVAEGSFCRALQA